jgi:hypothetical protein
MGGLRIGIACHGAAFVNFARPTIWGKVMLQEIIPALETARNKIRTGLSTIREYRAMLALEKCLSELSDVGDDSVLTLVRLKKKLEERLGEIREYRALGAIEKTIAEIHDILAETPSTTQPEPVGSPSIETAIARALMAEPSASVSDANTGKVA